MSIWAFVGACLASATAFWIAYRVYPHQRHLDRELQLRKELNDAYVELLSLVDRAASASRMANEADGYSVVFQAKAAINKILILEAEPPLERLDRLFIAIADIFETSTGGKRAGGKMGDSHKELVNEATALLNYQRAKLHGNSCSEVQMTMFISNRITGHEGIKP